MPEWFSSEVAVLAVIVPVCIFIYKLSMKMDQSEERNRERHETDMEISKETLNAVYETKSETIKVVEETRRESAEAHGKFLEQLARLDERTKA